MNNQRNSGAPLHPSATQNTTARKNAAKERSKTAVNVTDIQGFEFILFSSPKPETLHKLFLQLGFTLVGQHQHLQLDLLFALISAQ
jgi:4-hydroxyphenylpyruvate dioxygenase-like putative hemolysin